MSQQEKLQLDSLLLMIIILETTDKSALEKVAI